MRRIDPRVVRVNVVWLLGVGHVILSAWRTSLTAAAGWNHPAKQFVGKSSVLVVKAHRLSMVEVAAGTARSGIDGVSK